MSTGLLIYENGPYWLYKAGLHTSDASLLLVDAKGATHLMASPIELSEFRTKSIAQHIYTYTDAKKWIEKNDLKFSLINLVKFLMAKAKVNKLEIPLNFPARLFQFMQENKIDVTVTTRDPFFEEMAYLRADEIKKLQEAQNLATSSIELARSLIAAAEVRSKNMLYLGGQPLTSERVQGEMNAYAAGLGALEFHGGPIVSCGLAAATPHDNGHGPLYANETIVVDCFPRHKNYYWGDCTRTCIKGKASPWQSKLIDTTIAVQEALCAMIKPGASGDLIQKTATEMFDKAGFPTGEKKGENYGFTHSVGHHIGLDMRGPGARTLTVGGGPVKAGHALTVEPGLYYPVNINGGIGGCRIEDIVVATKTGHKNLTNLAKTPYLIP